MRFGGNWLHIIFRRIVLEAAQIWRELAPHYFPGDCFGLFWRQLIFGGNWLYIILGQLCWRRLRFGGDLLYIFFWGIVLEAAQFLRELAPHYFLRIVFKAAQIWWELAPHYFPADCFGGSSDLAGTGSTLFSSGLFLRQLKFGRNWHHIIFWRIVLEAAQI